MPAEASNNNQATNESTATSDAPATGGGTGGGGKSSSGGKGGGGGQAGGGGKPSMQQGQAGGGGKPGGNPFMSGTPGYQNEGMGFFDFNPRPIAGASPLLNQAGKMAGGLGQAGQGGVQGAYGALGQAGEGFQNLANLPGQTNESMDLFRSLPGIAGTQVTGANVANDPAVKAANEQFQNVMAPMIKDSAGLAGLGKSGAMTNALSSQQAQTLLPLIQGSIAREERGVDRLLGGTQAAAGGLFGGGQQAANQQQASASGMAGIGQALAGLGGQEQNMLMNAIGGLSGLGGQFRGIEQEQLNAPYDEQMRLFSEGLNSIYGPFGMIPGMFGSSSSSSGGGKK